MPDAPHYADDLVTLYAGDCLDVLRSMPDASVHAVVCDPPYGLADHKPERIAQAVAAWCSGDRDHVPDGKGFMGRAWDGFVPPPAVWDECLRVLRPGGHLLAFAGSRTVDLMGLSIRLAGFEIRDSVMWIMGSGFPKSLDVSKAIDKLNGRDMHQRYALARHIRERREAAGVSRAQVADRFPQYREVTANWERTDEHGNRVPTVADWAVLAPWLGLSDEWLPLVERVEAEREVIGAKSSGLDKGSGDTVAFIGSKGRNAEGLVDITAPATPAAEQWQGWGTALKPAHEPVVWAQKPFNAVVSWETVNAVHHGLGALLWLSIAPAKRAELASPSATPALPEGACASALAAAATATSPARSGATATYNSPALASTSSNIVSSWNAILGVLSDPTRTFTTSTASSTTTALRTLNSLLAPLTSPTTMPTCGCLLGGSSSPAPSAGTSSSDAWARWRHTLSASAPESAIEGIALAVSSALASVAAELSSGQAEESTAPPSATTTSLDESSPSAHASTAATPTSPAGAPGGSARSGAQGSPSSGGSHPAQEPIIVARKPLAGTVAANVLAHGTGAIHVDACRVGTTVETWPKSRSYGTKAKKFDTYDDQQAETQATGEVPAGRWPANVVLVHADTCEDGGACADGCPVAELDRQSGTTGAHGANRGGGQSVGYHGGIARGDVGRDPGTGGASRFFPVFRYQAKAPASERPKVNGVAHPTCKPRALMQFLARLVTRPGGTILDPFAGSGTTLEAGMLEGFHVIGVERQPEYLPLIEHRIERAHATLRERADAAAKTAEPTTGTLFDVA